MGPTEKRLYNLLRFHLLFKINEFEAYSMDYMIEKYNKYIGFEPYMLKDCIDQLWVASHSNKQIVEYCKRWGEPRENDIKGKHILIYAANVEACSILEMIDYFKSKIGSFDKINKNLGPMLHALVERDMVNEIKKIHSNVWNTFTREDKINQLMNIL